MTLNVSLNPNTIKCPVMQAAQVSSQASTMVIRIFSPVTVRPNKSIYILRHLKKQVHVFYYAPTIFNGGAYKVTAVLTYVRPVHPSRSVRPVRNTFGFSAISFERIGVLD